MTKPHSLRARMRGLYLGRSQTSRRFRYLMLGVDLATIGVFLLAAP